MEKDSENIQLKNETNLESKKRPLPQTDQRQNQKPISEMLPNLLLKRWFELGMDSLMHF